MGYAIKFDPRAVDELEKLGREHQRRIVRFLRERLAPLDNPRSIGEALHGSLHSFWKYRVGTFRIICSIQDKVVTVLVVRIGHRREVYR